MSSDLVIEHASAGIDGLDYRPIASRSADWPEGKGRLQQVDLLRGLAALSVALFHFTNGNPAFLPPGGFKSFCSYGSLGVQVFFVISGFIVPYSLWRARYRVPAFGRFLMRRIVRLDPPYLASIGLILLLNALSALAPGFQGSTTFSAAGLAAHLGYANVIAGYPWLNPVFWTLAIEVQFYLLIGLSFPLFTAESKTLRRLTICVALTLALVPLPKDFLGPWLPIFVVGILAFLLYVQRISAFEAGLCGALACGIATILHGMAAATLSGLAGLVLILWRKPVPRPFLLLGTVSYSFYLVHVPVGGRVVNLSLRLSEAPSAKAGALLTAFVLSLVTAVLLWKWVELPAQRWAGRVRYHPNRRRISKEAACFDATPMPPKPT